MSGLTPLIFVIYVIFFVWALASALSGKFENGDKTAWVVAIIFAPLIGIILYFTRGRHQKI
jgi:hypothetical protein